MEKKIKKVKIKKNVNSREKIELKSFIINTNPELKDGVLYFKKNSSVKEIANLLKKNPAEIISFFFKNKEMVKINTELTNEQIGELSLNYNFDFKEIEDIDETKVLKAALDDSIKKTNPDKRPPIITIMGHIDHGKTTLLDTIRKTKIAIKEAGGITQSIGAYQINFKRHKMTFIDTPGHEAFTQMRTRGSQITDIAIIVIAADDSIMPQTKESIEHAKTADIPIIIAINKIDSPKANSAKVRTDITNSGLFTESEIKKIYFVEISAKQNKNIDKLLEIINLISETEDYRSKNHSTAAGSVIETHLEKGKGNVVSLLVQYGTLEKGDTLILDSNVSNVRMMYDDNGKEIQKATPSTPVKIIGFSIVPDLGTKFIAVHNIKEAKKIAKISQDIKTRKKNIRQSNIKIEDFLKQKDDNDQKTLSIIIKGDSKGSIEALIYQIKKLSNDKVKVQIIRSDMGIITKSDILLSSANSAPIYSFNLKSNTIINNLIKKNNVKHFSYNVIYHMIEDIKKHMEGIQNVEYEEIYLGKAKIKKIFTFSKIGSIAGSQLSDGKVSNKAKVRISRDEDIIYDGDMSSLQIEKDSVKEVIGKGKEFAFTIKDFDDISEGDIAEFYELKEIVFS